MSQILKPADFLFLPLVPAFTPPTGISAISGIEGVSVKPAFPDYFRAVYSLHYSCNSQVRLDNVCLLGLCCSLLAGRSGLRGML